jgi:hypothetical protein
MRSAMLTFPNFFYLFYYFDTHFTSKLFITIPSQFFLDIIRWNFIIKGKYKVIPAHAIKTYWKLEAQLHKFLAPALVDKRSASSPSGFASEERAPGTYWWVSQRSHRCGKTDKSLACPRNRTTTNRLCSHRLVTILIAPTWLKSANNAEFNAFIKF